MSVYILNLGLIMFYGLVTESIERKSPNLGKKVFLTLVALQLGVLAGCRGSSVGFDTVDYLSHFNLVSFSLVETLNNLRWIEPGYAILYWLIKCFGGSGRTLILISSLFCSVCLCIFIYRYSREYFLSTLLVICFPYYYTSFDLIRHYIVLSFFLLGYRYVLNNELTKYVLLMLIASLFHKVALVLILFYFFRYIPWTKITIVLGCILSVLLMFLIKPLALLIGNLINKSFASSPDWLGGYAGGLKTLSMYFCLFCAAEFLYCKKKYKTFADDEAVLYIFLLFLSAIVFTRARMMIRFMVAMVPFMAIGFPQLLCGQKRNLEYWFVCFCLISVAMMYHTYMMLIGWQNIVPYVPFWI